MPHSVRLGKVAIADLKAIGDWIADRASEDVAENYVRRIETHCQTLAEFPQRGMARGDLPSGIRSIAFERRVTILYRVETAEVVIQRIFYAGRDIGRGFAND